MNYARVLGLMNLTLTTRAPEYNKTFNFQVIKKQPVQNVNLISIKDEFCVPKTLSYFISYTAGFS